MRRVQYHQFHAVRQRARATRPALRSRAEQVLTRTLAQSLDLLEADHDQIFKSGELEGI
jgi:hypothetical protein